MDITFKVENEKFNYRVCAMIIIEGRSLHQRKENGNIRLNGLNSID